MQFCGELPQEWAHGITFHCVTDGDPSPEFVCVDAADYTPESFVEKCRAAWLDRIANPPGEDLVPEITGQISEPLPGNAESADPLSTAEAGTLEDPAAAQGTTRKRRVTQ